MYTNCVPAVKIINCDLHESNTSIKNKYQTYIYKFNALKVINENHQS